MRSWSSHDLLRILLSDGWRIKHTVGSHVQLVHPTKPGKVTIPHPKKDLALGTVASIVRQAGLDPEALS
jgi:predicted RNA binding protein YcfA (HicA-like mRNA interferase family)